MTNEIASQMNDTLEYQNRTPDISSLLVWPHSGEIRNPFNMQIKLKIIMLMIGYRKRKNGKFEQILLLTTSFNEDKFVTYFYANKLCKTETTYKPLPRYM